MRLRLPSPRRARDQGRGRSPAPGTSARRSGAAAGGFAFGSGGRDFRRPGRAGRRGACRRRAGGRRLQPCGLPHGLRDLLQRNPRLVGHDAARLLRGLGDLRLRHPRIRPLELDEPLLIGNLVGMQAEARDRRNGAGSSCARPHVAVPGLRRQAAAGDAGHGAEVVVADPHAGHQRAGEADEPGIAIARAGAGLADDRGEVERRLLGRAVRHHRQHHLVHVLGHLAAHDLRPAAARRGRGCRSGRPWNCTSPGCRRAWRSCRRWRSGHRRPCAAAA